MASSIDELVGNFEQLVSTLREMKEEGQKSGKSSLSRAVDTQIGILNNAVHRSMTDCGALTYAKQYGSVQPNQVSNILRQIAATIDNSKNPHKDLVIEDIQKLITSISG
jgi:hypothetical protein